jgi:hypothetical protein
MGLASSSAYQVKATSANAPFTQLTDPTPLQARAYQTAWLGASNRKLNSLLRPSNSRASLSGGENLGLRNFSDEIFFA